MAAPVSTVEIMRRSTRVRAELQVRLRSLDPASPFDLLTRTLIVNAHGCGLQSSVDLPGNVLVELEINGRVATGRILNSALVDAEQNVYLTGVVLDQPSNFWGLASPPADWASVIGVAAEAKVHPFAKRKRPGPVPVATPAVHPFARPSASAKKPPPTPAKQQLEVATGTVPGTVDPAAALQRLRADAASVVAELRDEIRGGLNADVQAWRSESERITKIISDLLRRAEEQTNAAIKEMERVRSSAASAESKIAASLDSFQHATKSQQLTSDEVARARTELQQLTENAPGLVDRVVQERAGQAMDAVAVEARQKLSSALTSMLEDLQRRVSEMAEATTTDARERLIAGLDTRFQALLDASSARIREIEQREQASRASLDELTAELAHRAEEAMAGLRVQVEQASALSLEKVSAGFDAGQERLDTQIREQVWSLEAQAEAAGARLQEKLGGALQQLEADIARRQAELSSQTAQAAGKLTEESISTLRTEADRQAQSIREQAQNEATRLHDEFAARKQELDASAAALEAQHQALAQDLAQLQHTRSYIESLLSALPETVRSQVERQSAEAWEGLRQRSAEHIGETLRSEADRGARWVRQEVDAAAKQLREEMAQQAQQAAADLQSRLANMLDERQKRLATDLEVHAAGVQERTVAVAAEVERRLHDAEQRTEKAANSGEQRVREAIDRAVAELTGEAQIQAETHRNQAESVHRDAMKRLQEVAQKSDQLLGETEASLLKTASEAVDDELARARRELRQQTLTESDAALAELRARSHEAVAAQIDSATNAAAQATEAATRLKLLQEAAEGGSKALQAQLEEAKVWLQTQNTEFQRTIHDAFLSAGGEIRGRVHAAVDSAEELIRHKSKEAMSQLDAVAKEHAEEVARQAEEAQTRLDGVRANVTDSAEKALQSRLMETLEVFRLDASRLADSAISRWQVAMDETLRAIPGMLKVRLEEKTASPSAGPPPDLKG